MRIYSRNGWMMRRDQKTRKSYRMCTRLKKEADVLDTEAWYAANPALGIFRSLPDLEEQAKQAARKCLQRKTHSET